MALFTYDVPTIANCKQVNNQDVTSPRMDSKTFFHKAAPPDTSPKWRTQWHLAMEKYLGGSYGEDADWVPDPEPQTLSTGLRTLYTGLGTRRCDIVVPS